MGIVSDLFIGGSVLTALVAVGIIVYMLIRTQIEKIFNRKKNKSHVSTIWEISTDNFVKKKIVYNAIVRIYPANILNLKTEGRLQNVSSDHVLTKVIEPSKKEIIYFLRDSASNKIIVISLNGKFYYFNRQAIENINKSDYLIATSLPESRHEVYPPFINLEIKKKKGMMYTPPIRIIDDKITDDFSMITDKFVFGFLNKIRIDSDDFDYAIYKSDEQEDYYLLQWTNINNETKETYIGITVDEITIIPPDQYLKEII